MKQSGHTVLITGGASGIGLALAERFIQNGNKVIVIGRNEIKLDQKKDKHPGISTYCCDLASGEQLDALVQLLSAERLVTEFWASYRNNRLEIRVGKVKLLKLVQRWFPSLADKILKNS
ncbi:SDR family NAD(P)-dependent oxidoreductase [Cohnella cholangitidis]|uniref:SDR family NAD(P)-dependent oxidoreductase n=1 Tax=Cohnella cholangitidis TaxID=2598458 RepID=A0A7G5BYG0_9BACL|nr:SDR family NAD(P)-dependent oxidoreductase [Cohnella cholangitidis]QMV41994.1 SDR family NAD(P)-dependent oxidoreductase [Cohnella cholangitidis]